MAPQGEPQESTIATQSLYVIRHGDRWDYQHPEWKATSKRPGDPSLSTLGFEQARQVGQYLNQVFVEEDVTAEEITVLSSPFLRTVQTSNEMLAEMQDVKGDASDTVKIKPEYGVFELDIWNGDFHESLPNIEERQCYFPRLESDYSTLFVPDLPEDCEKFFDRCDEAMKRIGAAYPCHEDNNRVLIIVTHAACCIGLVKSGTGCAVQEITAAAPCSIYKMTRTTEEEKWTIDHYSKEGGTNGYTGHMKDVGSATVPWNNFGEDKTYSGPPLDNDE
mmetsp:Transcript_16573/g.24183  ORF Transcript_16573/g.24183 Transcript_16573/m.24183 type:complete len:276 (-) Transcript_16573:642-1469(-)